MNTYIIISFIILFLVIILLIRALFSNDKQYKELRDDFEDCCDNLADVKTKLNIYENVHNRMRNTLLDHTSLTNRDICKKYDAELTERLLKLKYNNE